MLRTGSATRTKPPARQLLETHAQSAHESPVLLSCSPLLVFWNCRTHPLLDRSAPSSTKLPKPGLTGPIVVQTAVRASSSSDTSRPAIEISSTFRHLSADKLHSGGPQHSLVQLSRSSALTGSVSWLSLSPSFQSRRRTPLKRSERRATTTA